MERICRYENNEISKEVDKTRNTYSYIVNEFWLHALGGYIYVASADIFNFRLLWRKDDFQNIGIEHVLEFWLYMYVVFSVLTLLLFESLCTFHFAICLLLSSGIVYFLFSKTAVWKNHNNKPPTTQKSIKRNSKIGFSVYKTIVISHCCVVYVLCLNSSKGLKQSARAECEFTKYQTMTTI